MTTQLNKIFAALVLISIVQIGTGEALGQAVQTDGTTNTSVSTAPDGRITIDIAPANAQSVSLNRFEQFNVPASGVALNNRAVAAGTIVNEVTSLNPTRIEGQLEVLGPSANVIVANPNGITVNGGRFVNTGNLSLVTGRIQLDGIGRAQAIVTDGTLTVEDGGLSGTMAELDLIARSLRLRGSVTHDVVNADAKFVGIAGQSEVLFDPAAIGSPFLPYARITSVGSGQTQDVVVDISRPVSLRAGSVTLTVTEQGAGVRLSGDVIATDGGFRLSSNGRIEFTDAVISADQSVGIRGAEIAIASGSRQTTVTSVNSGVVMESRTRDVELENAVISGRIIASDNLASAGGVTIISQRDITQRQSAPERPRGKLTGSEQGIALFADRSIHLSAADMESAENITLSAGENVALSDINATVDQTARILATGGVQIGTSRLTAQQSIRIDGADIEIASDPAADTGRSELRAVAGGITIVATGNFGNSGGLIQGNNRTAGDVTSTGGVTIIADRDVLNTSLDIDHLGVLFGENDDLVVRAGGDLRNLSARLFSNQSVSVTAGGDVVNETERADNSVLMNIASASSGGLLSGVFGGSNMRMVQDFGETKIPGELALVLGVNDVTIAGQNIANEGGDITGRGLTLTANGEIRTNGLLVGRMTYKRTCSFRCRSRGTSTVQRLGGSMNATGAMTLTAGDVFAVSGGQVISGGDLTVNAPRTTAGSVVVPVILSRPSGLTSGFSGNQSWLLMRRVQPQFVSQTGQILFNGSVEMAGALIVAPGNVQISGADQRRDAEADNLLGRQNLGFLGGLF